MWTGRLYWLDDLGTQNIVLRYVYRDALLAGDSFLWSPSFHSGFYLFGEGQAGMAHPLHLLLYRLFPLHLSLSAEMASSYVIALVGGALLLRRLGLSREAAWFGAMTFAFGGFNLLHVVHVNMVAVIAEAPWLLLATHVILSSAEPSRRAAGFAGTALILGSQLLLGHPQMVWMTLLVTAFLVFCQLRAGVSWSRLPLQMGALTLGLLIGAVQLLPTLDVLGTSTRAEPSLAFRLSLSLSPLNLVQLWSPLAFKSRIYALPGEGLTHEFGLYNGAFCSLSLVWLAVRWRELQHRALARALLAFAAVAMVLALGQYGGVYSLLARVPGVGAFRVPARHIVLFQLALAGLAAVAFDDLRLLLSRRETITWRRLWPLALFGAASIGTTLTTSILVQTGWAAAHGFRFSGALQSGAGAGVVLGMIAVLGLAARGRAWALPLIVVLAALDLGTWGYYDLLRGPSGTPDALAAAAPAPPHARAGDSFEASVCSPWSNLGVMRRLRLSTGCLGLGPVTAVDPTTPLGMHLAGVQWRPALTGWEPTSSSAPRVRLMSIARQSRDVVNDARATDMERVALVEAPLDALDGPPGTTRLLSDRPGLIQVQTTGPGRQLLVTTERFHAGWGATEDGRTCATVRVNGDYLGCVVNAGEHVVTFRFAPASARNGAMLTLTGLVLTFVTTIALLRRRGSLTSRV